MTLQEIAQDEDTAARFIEAVLAPTDDEIQSAVDDAADNPPTSQERAMLDRVTERIKRL